MSYFDDGDIERFIVEVCDEEAQFHTRHTEFEQEELQRSLDLIASLGRQGITAALIDPDLDDTYSDYPKDWIKVVSTSAGLKGLTESIEFSWSYFANQLSCAKGLDEYGGGGGLDPVAIETATKALEVIVTNDFIETSEKQAAIIVAKEFVGSELIGSVLQNWGFNPDQDIASDPLFSDKVELIKISMTTIEDQEQHNREITRALSSQLEDKLCEILPIIHDDFFYLYNGVLVAITSQFCSFFEDQIEKDGSKLEAVKSTINLVLNETIMLHNLDSYELAEIAISMAPLYEDLGYRSID
jgi:chaperonin cofactor prefoldin